MTNEQREIRRATHLEMLYWAKYEPSNAKVPHAFEAMREALIELIPPVVGLLAVHWDGKHIAPQTVEALRKGEALLREALLLAQQVSPVPVVQDP